MFPVFNVFLFGVIRTKGDFILKGREWGFSEMGGSWGVVLSMKITCPKDGDSASKCPWLLR